MRAVRMIAVDQHMDTALSSYCLQRGERRNMKIFVLCCNKAFLDSDCFATQRYSCPHPSPCRAVWIVARWDALSSNATFYTSPVS